MIFQYILLLLWVYLIGLVLYEFWKKKVKDGNIDPKN